MAVQEEIKKNQVNIQALGTYLAQVMAGLDDVGRRIHENGAQITKNGAQITKNGIQITKNGIQITKISENIDKIEKRMDLRDERADKRLAKMQKEIKEANKRYGYFSETLSRSIELLVIDNIDNAIFDSFNTLATGIFPNIKGRKMIDGKKRKKEFDIVAIAGKDLFLVEIKKTVTQEYIDEFYTVVNSGEFITWFPEFKGYTIKQIMAARSIEESMIQDLISKNIYPMIMKGDVMEIIK